MIKYFKYIIFSMLLLFPVTVLAAGSVTVDKTSLNIAPNKATTFNIIAKNSAGKVTITSSDTSIVTVNKTSEWVENGTLTVTATGKKTGNARITVVVDAATFDKEVIKKTYTINVRVQSNTNTLNSLSLSNGTLSPAFNPNTNNYTATIDAPSTVISATLTDPKSKITGIGTKTLVHGKNTLKVIVTSESGIAKTYTITITRPDNRSTNNNLKSLTSNQGAINFNKNTTSYNLNVASNVSSITLNATLEDTKASFVKGYGPRTVNLNYGNNAIQIRVLAENATVKIYTINVNRKDNRSSNNYLKDITLSNGSIVFNKDVLNYNTTVYYDITKINVVATPEDAKSKVVVNSPNLNVGNNVITINVTSENGQVRTYKIVVNRLSADQKMSDNNNISSIKVLGHEVDFKTDTLEYELNIKDEYALVFEINLEDPKASYKIEGNEDLKDGSVIKVVSTSESGQTKEYKFNVTKEEKKEPQSNNSIMNIIFASGGFLLGVGITLIFTKSKKSNQLNQNNNMNSYNNNNPFV